MAHALAETSDPAERIRIILREYLPHAELDSTLAEVVPGLDLGTVERVIRNVAQSPQSATIVRVSTLESLEDPGYRQLLFELDRNCSLDERLDVAAELDERLRADESIDFDVALRDTTFGV